MATWTPPADAVETQSEWAPPTDSQEVSAQTPPKLTPFQQTYNQKATAPVAGPVGQIEAGMNAVTGMAASAMGGLRGLGTMITGGSVEDATRSIQQTQQALTYQPRTESGKYSASIVADIFGLPSLIGGVTGEAIGGAVGNEAAGEAIGKVAPDIAMILTGGAKPIKSVATTRYTGTGLPSMVSRATQAAPAVEIKQAVQARQAQANSAADWQNAPRIEAAQAARNLPYPVALNPAMSNPTVATKAATVAADTTKLNAALSKQNMNAWANNAKKDMGIHADVPLTSDAPFKAVRTRDAAPYREVSKMGRMDVDPNVIAKLNDVAPPDLAVNAGSAPKVQAVVDNITAKLDAGMTGAQVLAEIKGLRASAKSLFNSDKFGSPNPVAVAEAQSHIKIANALEDLIESNVSAKNPSLLPEIQSARKKMATSYVYQNAVDYNTGILDPNKIAKQTAVDPSVTGIAKDIGNVAGNFPEVANVAMSVKEPIFTKYTRAGVGGGLGLAAGTALGTPLAPMMAVGAGITTLGGMLTRKKILGSKYQSKSAVPADRRIFPTEPTPPAPEPTRMIGAEGYVPPTPFREVPPTAPNFTMNDGTRPPLNEYVQPQIGMSEGPVGGQAGAVNIAAARENAQRSAAARAAEQAQAAAEAAAPRQPTRGGMLFDLDPVTGKLRAADQGVKGATPEIFQANTGANLQSASQKIAQGRAFDMTAAEKVAWNKTKVDLVESVPELKGLSEKQIFAKMADREWVQTTIDKVRQQEQMYAQIAERSQDRVAQSMARIQREKMTDILEQLQESLMAPRPTNLGGQGPKTRAFKRGLLTGENQ